MIKELTNKKVWVYKSNWIDQNNVVVGYDDEQRCCENFGWGVYDKKSRVWVADDPSGMPYHFGAVCDHEPFVNLDYYLHENTDIDQIELLPDDGKSPVLVFEFYNCHNGYYYHEFKIRRNSQGK